MKKKCLCISLAIVLVLSMSTSAFAQDDASYIQRNENFDGIYQEIPTENVDIEDLTSGSNMPYNIEIDLSGSSLSEGTELVRNTRAATQSWTGTIANEGEMSYVFATLESNQIVNATLECPLNENLDYDLFIYDVDATGTLGQMRSASTTKTYFNSRTSKTVDEGAAYINKSSQTQDYAIIIFATKGGSVSDAFKLTVSVAGAGTYDSAEPNDSPFNAYTVALGTTISGPNLHVVNDQDWYVMRVDDTYSAARISAATTIGEYKIELYHTEDAKMVRHVMRNDTAYTLSPGVYFICVSKNTNGFSAQPYTLNVIALSYANESKIEFSKNVDGGKPSENQYIVCPAYFELEVKVPNVPGEIGFVVSTSDTLDQDATIFSQRVDRGDNVIFSTSPLQLPYGKRGVYVRFYNENSSTVYVEATVRSKFLPIG